MHELSLCHSIATIVNRFADGRDVDKVHVQVGAFRQVVPETLVYSWELVTDSTALAGSELVVEQIPAVIECAACGATTTLSLPILKCGSCETTTVTLRSGEEFLVTSLDLKGVVHG